MLNVYDTLSQFYYSHSNQDPSFRYHNPDISSATKNFEQQCSWLKRLIWLNKFTFVMAFIINLSPYLFFEDVVTALIYGVPNALVFSYWGYHFYMSINIPLLYFFMICKYVQ